MTEYSKSIHNKSTEIGRELLTFLLADKETFIPSVTETVEEKAALQEKTLDAANKVMAFMATQDIPARYATMGIEKVIDALTGLKSFVDGTLNIYEDEYLSRMFGIKNEDGKFRRDSATIGDIVLKLEEARQATGNNKADFFNEVAPQMPTAPASVAPTTIPGESSESSVA